MQCPCTTTMSRKFSRTWTQKFTVGAGSRYGRNRQGRARVNAGTDSDLSATKRMGTPHINKASRTVTLYTRRNACTDCNVGIDRKLFHTCARRESAESRLDQRDLRVRLKRGQTAWAVAPKYHIPHAYARVPITAFCVFHVFLKTCRDSVRQEARR